MTTQNDLNHALTRARGLAQELAAQMTQAMEHALNCDPLPDSDDLEFIFATESEARALADRISCIAPEATLPPIVVKDVAEPVADALQSWLDEHGGPGFGFVCVSGEALENLWRSGQPGTTMSPIGPAEMVACWKCPECGHSFRTEREDAGDVGAVFETWLETQESKKYAGQHVAFVPATGKIIASSESLGKLLSERLKIDPEKTSIVGLVPG